MAKRLRMKRTAKAGVDAPNNGGILGTGIFGMIGSVNTCSATDNTFYCQLSRFVSSLIMICILAAIVYMFYTVIIVPYVIKRKNS